MLQLAKLSCSQNFRAGFAGKCAPSEKGRCPLETVKGCVKTDSELILFHFPFQVTYLEKKVTELENDSVTNGDLKSKLKQENTQLVHRC